MDSEKIGTSVYFWAFPSKATASHKRRLQEKDEAIQDAKKRLKTAENSISQAKVGREDGDKRAQVSLSRELVLPFFYHNLAFDNP